LSHVHDLSVPRLVAEAALDPWSAHHLGVLLSLGASTTWKCCKYREISAYLHAPRHSQCLMRPRLPRRRQARTNRGSWSR